MSYQKTDVVGPQKTGTQVSETLNELFQQISNLDDYLLQLEARLEKVMHADGPTASNGATAANLVPLACELNEAKERVRRQSCRVESWLNRIEI